MKFGSTSEGAISSIAPDTSDANSTSKHDDAVPESLFLSRRQFMQGGAALAATALLASCGSSRGNETSTPSTLEVYDLSHEQVIDAVEESFPVSSLGALLNTEEQLEFKRDLQEILVTQIGKKHVYRNNRHNITYTIYTPSDYQLPTMERLDAVIDLASEYLSGFEPILGADMFLANLGEKGRSETYMIRSSSEKVSTSLTNIAASEEHFFMSDAFILEFCQPLLMDSKNSKSQRGIVKNDELVGEFALAVDSVLRGYSYEEYIERINKEAYVFEHAVSLTAFSETTYKEFERRLNLSQGVTLFQSKG